MLNILKIKSSVVAGKIPTTNDLVKGEAAVNHTDKKMWLRNPSTDEVWSLGSGATSYNSLTDKPTLGTAAATASTDYATSAQGTKADSALQAAALTPYRTSAAQDTIDAGKVVNGGGAATISVMTEAAYTALPTKDNNTIYILI